MFLKTNKSFSCIKESVFNNYIAKEKTKNYSEFEITHRNKNSRFIKIPINKYTLEMVKPDNYFVDIPSNEVREEVKEFLNDVYKFEK